VGADGQLKPWALALGESQDEELSINGETIFDRLGDLPQVAALIGWTLVRLDAGSDSIHLSFTALESFTNPAGSVHGGFIVAMLDECMGSAIVGLTDAQFLPATVSMSTDFIKPVLVGKVFGDGHITSRSNSFAFVEAKLSDPGGQILARATGTYRLRPFQDAVGRAAR
jgi:uncharacterized protein (TIGR00369 family)